MKDQPDFPRTEGAVDVPHSAPAQSIPVLRADDLRVTTGANLGDGLGVLDELVLDDVYTLAPGAARDRLSLIAHSDGLFEIGPDSALGQPGATVHLDCAVDFMSPDGQITEAVVLVETDEQHHIREVYLLPLSPLVDRVDYTLMGIDGAAAARRFAQVACVSFTRGTRITMASGAQVPIEEIAVGDRVLTRDHGVQEVRWIGHSTVRAVGDMAPIVIRAGTLNNARDLMVSPDHRLFIYQRTDRIGAGQSEVLVKARHLVNGDSVVVQHGGHVEYFQILFDRHYIIYAEGIAAESLLVDPRTRPVLPPELLERLADLLPGHGRGGHGVELQRALLDRPDAIDLLRRASMR